MKETEQKEQTRILSEKIRDWILGRRPGYKFYIKSELNDEDPIKKVYPQFGDIAEPRENLRLHLEKLGYVFNTNTKKKIYNIESNHSINDINFMIDKYPKSFE